MKLYFMGICGTAMGQAALLARAEGHEVTGADAGVYPPMSGVLAAAGVAVSERYDPARLERVTPDLVVIGNAQSRGNPEVEWLLETRRFPFTSLPAFLHDLVLRGRRNIVVAGTHGKTTTTALTAFLLRENGRDPGFLIGGVPQDPPMGNHLGAPSEPFVIEGDEYDSAFFDKRSKFIHYAPHIAVLNNLEFDHADIFRDLADVSRTFSHLVRIVTRNGFVLLNGDDPNLAALGPMPWTQVVRVGTGAGNDARIRDFAESAGRIRISPGVAGPTLGRGALVAARAVQCPQRRHGRGGRQPGRGGQGRDDQARRSVPVSGRETAPGGQAERSRDHGDRGFRASSHRHGRDAAFPARPVSGSQAGRGVRTADQHGPDSHAAGGFFPGFGRGGPDLSRPGQPRRPAEGGGAVRCRGGGAPACGAGGRRAANFPDNAALAADG